MSYVFDEFKLDKAAFTLTEQQQPVAIEPKVFDVLTYLIEHRDRVVSKEELLEQHWPGRVITDATLNTCIRSVRRALGDDHKQQKYIRTFPKRGFQFVGTLCSASQVDSVSVLHLQDKTRWRRYGWWGGALAILLTAILLITPGLSEKPTPLAALNTDRTAIAVLDFVAEPAAQQQYDFNAGLTEELIAGLARYRELFVIARNSSTQFAADSDIRQVRQELGVGYVVIGKVRFRKDTMQVRAKLISTTSRQQVWSQEFKTERNDLYALENELASQIAGQVVPELVQADVEAHRKQSPSDLDAWALYHKARAIQAVFTKDNQQQAIDWAQMALTKDPSLAAAYGIIARAKGVQFFYQWTTDEDQTLREAIDFAHKAIELDGNDPNAFAALGYVYRYTGDEVRSIANLERAVLLNPSDANIRLEFAHTLDWFRQQERALPEIKQAIRLSPRDPRLQNMYFYQAHILFHLKDFTASLEATRHMSGAITTDTWRMFYHLMRAADFAQLEQLEQAKTHVKSAREINPKMSIAAMRKKFEGSKNHPENRRFWLESLMMAGLPE